MKALLMLKMNAFGSPLKHSLLKLQCVGSTLGANSVMTETENGTRECSWFFNEKFRHCALKDKESCLLAISMHMLGTSRARGFLATILTSTKMVRDFLNF